MIFTAHLSIPDLRYFLLLNFIVFAGIGAKTQNPQIKTDSTQTADSLRYVSIEKFAQQQKATSFLHSLVFRSVTVKSGKYRPKTVKKHQKPEGKIIRQIHILTLDPFGYNINDTSVSPSNPIIKTANITHIKTRTTAVKNMLLFKEHTPYDSLLVMESERLIRAQRYVRDVMIINPVTNDSVDIYIRVWDVWSLIPSLSFTETNTNIELKDYDFIGLGHQFRARGEWFPKADSNVMFLEYTIPNIGNSYISANLKYMVTGKSDLIKSIDLSRPFISPLMRYAGGFYLGQLVAGRNFISDDSIISLAYRSELNNMQDIWAARSWQLFGGNTFDVRTSNLILSARFFRSRYPETDPEKEKVFLNQTILLAGFGLSSRKYFQDKYFFDFGKTEDVPVGRAFGITAGKDLLQTRRWYLGFKAAWGNYYRFGYLAAHLEYGTFFNFTGESNQEVVNAKINYSTPLFNLGKWKIRQFAKPVFIVGFNRLPSESISFSEGMTGFEGLLFSATKMMVLNLQTQVYSPLDVYGFRFGPFLFASAGMLADNSGFAGSRLYSMLGLGLLIKNDYLNFNTFQFSLAFYPIIPGQGENLFKTNAYKTTDYGFSDFEISKPGIVYFK